MTTETLTADKPTPFDISGQAIQDLRDYKDASVTLAQLWSDLEPTLPARLPEDECIERLTKEAKNVCWATVMHWVYNRILQQITQRLKGKEIAKERMFGYIETEPTVHTLVTAEGSTADESFYLCSSGVRDLLYILPLKLTIAEHDFLHAGMCWLVGAVEAARQEVAANPDHPYRGLFDELAQWESKQYEAQIAVDERKQAQNPDYQRERAPTAGSVKELVLAGTYANLMTTMHILRQLQDESESVYPARPLWTLREQALENIARLGDLSTVNTTVFNRLVGSINAIYEDENRIGGAVRANHKSLQKGPWPRPRKCPAPHIVRSPSESERNAARRFFNMEVMPSLSSDPALALARESGAFSLTTSILAIGTLLAEETIWVEGYDPTGLGVSRNMARFDRKFWEAYATDQTPTAHDYEGEDLFGWRRYFPQRAWEPDKKLFSYSEQ